MAILPIRTFPDPVLRRTCEDAEPATDQVRRLATDMLETMYAAPGIGLAAPQVGENIRLITVDVGGALGTSDPQVLLNPRITASSETIAYEEGCLSLPEIYEDVARPERLTLKAQDRDGNAYELEAEGLLARAICHEIDHLDGRLIVDYISSLKRNLIKKKMKKRLAQTA